LTDARCLCEIPADVRHVVGRVGSPASPEPLAEHAVPIDVQTPERWIARAFGSRGGTRFAAFVALIAAGTLDFATGGEFASALFYVPILLALAFVEVWGICLAYTLAAAGIALGVDLLHDPARAVFVRPYGAALVDWAIFALIACGISLPVRVRRRARESERALQDKTLELQDKQRRLDEARREAMQLRDDLTRREHQAEIGDAVFAMAHELERPLASAAVYVEELTRQIGRARVGKNPQLVLDDLQPLLEKLEERVQSMDRLLKDIRDLRKPGSRA
jgi:signal transduction histidine kinase